MTALYARIQISFLKILKWATCAKDLPSHSCPISLCRYGTVRFIYGAPTNTGSASFCRIQSRIKFTDTVMYHCVEPKIFFKKSPYLARYPVTTNYQYCVYIIYITIHFLHMYFRSDFRQNVNLFLPPRDGWGYCYAGGRATYGFTSGKVWYEVKVLENLEVRVEKDNTTFDIRIGWSTDDSGMMLGKLRVTCYQCWGSGSRCLFLSWFRDG